VAKGFKLPGKVEVDASGASRITFTGELEEVDLDASGASKIVIDTVKGGPITAKSRGTSDIVLKGTSDTAVVDAGGTSTVELETIPLKQAIATASGASTITIKVAQKLEAKASGTSKVEYVGTPKEVAKQVSGVGQVRPKP
jgi:hypothetical protein